MIPATGVPSIDLAVAVGESAAAPGEGLLLSLASTAYVACGAHAGDALLMGRTVRQVADRGITLGAHLSYPDLAGRGERPLDLEDRELQDMVLAQVGGLAAIARAAGSRVAVARCHGALGNDVSHDERTAQVVARSLYRFDPKIALACLAGSAGVRVARDCGLRVIEEAVVDRACDGRWFPLHADSVCLRGDAAQARSIVQAVHDMVLATGLRVAATAGRRNARQAA